MFMNMLNKTLIICQAVIFNWYGGWLRWKEEKYKCDDFQDSVFREEGCEESIKKARRIANQRSARILDPGNSRREWASFFLAQQREMIFWSLDLVSKHESNKMESRSRLEIREWSYDNLNLVSPGESKKINCQSRLKKLHLLSRVRVRFEIQPNNRAA